MLEQSPQNQKIIDRLMLDHTFLKIRDSAKLDLENLGTYVAEVRCKFKLSPYWDGIVSWLLIHDELVKNLPISGGMVDSTTDKVTGKEYYSIPVYPETTQANIDSSAKQIRKRYKEQGETIDIRKSGNHQDKIEYRALELHESGKSYSEIVNLLEAEFEETLIVTDIPTLIHKAKNKSLRVNTDS